MARQKTLESVQKQIEALKRQEADLKAKAREAQRREEERRKLIAGTLALEHADRSEAFRDELQRLLAEKLERDEDRALFGLPPKEKPATGTGDVFKPG